MDRSLDLTRNENLSTSKVIQFDDDDDDDDDNDDDDDDDDDADDVPGGTLKFSRIRTVDVDRQVDVLGIIEQEQSGLFKNLKI